MIQIVVNEEYNDWIPIDPSGQIKRCVNVGIS